MKTILQIKNVQKVYGQRSNIFTALHGINMEIQEGELVGIMGPSGAGKTTLLNIISTIDKPTTGTITVDGDNIVIMPENQLSAFRRDKLGFIFQDYNLLDTLTLKENIILPLTLAEVNYQEIERRVKEIARMLTITDLLDKFPYQVSGGQKQRAAAARAMINKPKLVLADEPTGNLDSKSATELLNCLRLLNESHHVTILLVTHDAFAASYCQRILFIKDGEIFSELVKGRVSRKDFFHKILDVLAVLGGDQNDLI
ncbi:MAG: ABC transporter ATP-binding protein [Halanaerobiales bacterium]|nr:ABC transporter ATP-binding protein [Halanaerobiales bacterium]